MFNQKRESISGTSFTLPTFALNYNDLGAYKTINVPVYLNIDCYSVERYLFLLITLFFQGGVLINL